MSIILIKQNVFVLEEHELLACNGNKWHISMFCEDPLPGFLSHGEYIIRHNLFLMAMKYTVCPESSCEMQCGTFTLFYKKSLRTFLHIGSATYEQ